MPLIEVCTIFFLWVLNDLNPNTNPNLKLSSNLILINIPKFLFLNI